MQDDKPSAQRTEADRDRELAEAWWAAHLESPVDFAALWALRNLLAQARGEGAMSVARPDGEAYAVGVSTGRSEERERCLKIIDQYSGAAYFGTRGLREIEEAVRAGR